MPKIVSRKDRRDLVTFPVRLAPEEHKALQAMASKLTAEKKRTSMSKLGRVAIVRMLIGYGILTKRPKKAKIDSVAGINHANREPPL